VSKKFDFPKWLQRSEEEVAAEQKIQAERQAGFTRAHLTEGERLVQHGVLLEETARGNLAAGAGDDAKAQLAEGLSLQGRFDEAATHHPDKVMRAEYRRVQQAIERPDDEKCACPDEERTVSTGGEKVELSITPRYSEKTVFSIPHGGAVQLITCRKCEHANARAPRSRLLTQSAAMSQNLAMARGQTERGRLSDIQILRKSNA